MKNVYIQQENNEFIYDFCYEASVSFKYLNWWNRSNLYTIRYISLDETKIINFTNEDLFIGSIEFMKTIFGILKIDLPKPINIPVSLVEHCQRKVWIANKKDLHFPVFIKPFNDLKLFDGAVLENDKNMHIIFPQIKNDTLLLCSEPVNFLSEWRGFVFKNKLIDLKHYLGDFKIFPNIEEIEKTISDYTDSPIAYAIDFGIDDKGRTLLIEVNDFFSVGTYGFSGQIYGQMIEARLKEMGLK
jgi:hypothetical protein